MGRFSKKETIFYKKLYRGRDNEIDEVSELICWLRNFVSKEYYSLPYFAIRTTRIDYIFRTHSPRVIVKWDELESVHASVSMFRFLLKSGAAFRLRFSDLDYASVQTMKEEFSKQDLLNKKGRE